MIDKIVPSVDAALEGVRDGATVMIGGFGGAGQPNELIDALIAQGARDLTIVNNNAGNGETGLAALLEGRPGAEDHLLVPAPGRLAGLRRACTAPARSSSSWCRRATSPSASAPPAPASAASSRRPATAPSSPKGKETREIDGRMYVLEAPIHADVALIKAERGDRWGNLVYRKTARNFGPVMAMAAKLTVASVHEIVELGELDPGSDRHAGHLRAARGPRAAHRDRPGRLQAGGLTQRSHDAEADPRPDGRARRARHPRRRVREPRHRPADAGRQPPAEGPRDLPAQRERPARHGPGAARRARRTTT